MSGLVVALGNLTYGLFAETIWLLIGSSVGFFGLFLGVSVAPFGSRSRGAGQALSFMPMITAPLCALISALTAMVMQFYDQSAIAHRVQVCGMVNLGMFAFLFFGAGLLVAKPPPH